MTMNDRILVVDDESVLRNNLARYLRLQGYEVDTVGSAEAALEALESSSIGLVLTDLRMPGMDGLTLIRHLQTEHPDALTVLMTAYASVESAVEALRAGASDYLLKPIALDALGRKVADLFEKRELHERVRRLRQEVRERVGIDLVGHSPAMAAVESLIDQVAPTPANVLLEGESGTGKEVVARALHERSDRADRDFIAVNLAAQPDTLVDATLFGYEKGAYTGATGARDGVLAPCSSMRSASCLLRRRRSCCASSRTERSCHSGRTSPARWSSAWSLPRIVRSAGPSKRASFARTSTSAST